MKYRGICLWTNGSFEICGDKIWLVPYWMNMLCSFDMKTQLLDKVIHFPGLSTASLGFFI